MDCKAFFGLGVLALFVCCTSGFTIPLRQPTALRTTQSFRSAQPPSRIVTPVGRMGGLAMMASTAELATKFNKEHHDLRLKLLEDQAIADLKKAVENYENPVFTTALIAGDDVILHLIHKAGLLGKIKIIFVDTFHLFPETYDFLAHVEKHYGFKAHMFKAEGCESTDEFHAKYGDDLFLEDVEEYDRLAKVEPLLRSLKELKTKLWINGRRRDQGFERAAMAVWEKDKMQPLTYWTFEDCWDYIKAFEVPYHPLHDDGYPSLGDMHSTLRVDKEKWFQYGMERAGRFQNMQNADGSDKTECGIHTVGTSITE